MKIFLGADHGGFALKEKMKIWLVQQGHDVEDCGAFSLQPDDDYTDFAFQVAEKVAQAVGQSARGILFCRTGSGVVIAANKVKGIRAAYVSDTKEVQHARDANDVNIIGIGADDANEDQTKEIISAFLNTSFSGADRHKRRIKKIEEYERNT